MIDRTRNKIACIVYCIVACCGCAAGAGSTDIAGPAVASSTNCLVALADDTDKKDANYLIQAGDGLDIGFYLNPEFDSKTTVRPDGKIELPVAGEVTAAGLTPAQLATSLDQAYSGELLKPRAFVRVESTPNRVVYVAGEVGHPGAVPMQTGMTALQAITQAGGLTNSAGANNVLLIRRDGCGNAHTERLDLATVLAQKNNDEDVGLLPTDIVIVPRSGIAQVGLIVKQYIRDLLPVSPYLNAPIP